MKVLILVTFAILAAGCSSAPKSSETPTTQASTKKLPMTIEEAVNSDYRTPENRVRDVYRHPAETLAFFGLQPNMTVVEISPGTGWYSQILVPLLAQNGKFYAATVPSGENDYLKKMNASYSAWLKSHPELESKVALSSFSLPNAEVAPEGTADMILTFRNVHNWMAQGQENAAFKSFFKALKPGGTLGVVEHRADPKKKQDPKAKSGYVRERDVIRMAEKAGFKLVAKSEINANPKDTKDHPEGVWTLPPTYRLGDKDRAKYEAIGESDRMTLKFVKPAK